MRKRYKYDDHPGLFDVNDFSLPPFEPIVREAERRRASSLPGGKMEAAPECPSMTFISFGSGSSGNSAYIGDDRSGLIIDAGVDMDRITTAMDRNGLQLSRVRGVLLTHDHSDHVRYLYTLLRRLGKDAKLFCTPRTLGGILRRHSLSRRVKDYHTAIYKEFAVTIDNFIVTPFGTDHDGTDNVGFHIRHTPTELEFVVATDLGTVNDRVDHYLHRADNVMIEANYDRNMLIRGHYPEHLKHRIMSDIGHLDNTRTAEQLATLDPERLRNVFLCHLSADNNTPELALQAVRQKLPEKVAVTVLPRFEATKAFILTR